MRRGTRFVALFTVGALALAACGGEEEAAVPEPEEAIEEGGEAAGAPSVTTVDNSFAPDALTLAAGEEVTIEVRNAGQNPHTFTIDELEVDTGTLATGDTATVTFTMPDTEVEYYCTVHGRAVMSGTISVG